MAFVTDQILKINFRESYKLPATTVIDLALQIASEFVLEINIGLMGRQIRYGGDTDHCKYTEEKLKAEFDPRSDPNSVVWIGSVRFWKPVFEILETLGQWNSPLALNTDRVLK